MAIEPTSTLVEPTVEPHFMETFNDIIGFPQYVSPSYWLGVAMKEICGCNPFEWVAEQYAGDWHLVMKASKALTNLSSFNAAYAESIRSHADPLFKDGWTGGAATEADKYFDGLILLLRGQVEPLKKVAQGFSEAAIGVMETADAIKGHLETLVDLLIALGIELAATAAASWTVVGGVAGGVIAALTAARAYQIWTLIVKGFDLAWNIVQGSIGLIMGYLGALDGLKVQPIPKTAYRATGLSFEIPGA